MRLLIVILFSCITAFVNPIQANPSVYPKVKQALLALQTDPEFSELAAAGLKRLPYCNLLLQEAVFLPQKERYRLDIILYDREPITRDLDRLNRSFLSHERVSHLLDSLNYAVVGYEGTHGDSISVDWLIDYFWKAMLDQGWAVSKDSIAVETINSLSYDGVFSFMMAHPEGSWVVGIQDKALADLYSGVCYSVFSTAQPRADLVELKSLLERFRCEIALARVMRALSHTKMLKERRGVLVVGYLQLEHLQGLIKMFGIKSTVYDARMSIVQAVP